MGWETRGNQSYYYRKQRRAGQVVSEYVGRGELAEIIATLTGAGLPRSDLDRLQRESEREDLAYFEGDANAFDEAVATLTGAALLTAGYHRHKRQWRLKRG